jgi:hypothetical protein
METICLPRARAIFRQSRQPRAHMRNFASRANAIL